MRRTACDRPSPGRFASAAGAVADETMTCNSCLAALLIAALAGFAGAAPAAAQTAKPPPTAELADRCPGLVAGAPRHVHPAALRRTALAQDQARITYVGHSTFLIESPKLVRIATDYNNYVKPQVLPDIVTMNRAHSTHYTDSPESGIKHVLRGWSEDGRPSAHDLTYQDVRVRSVATNIRDWAGGTQRHGNSVFIFELANLCIAHLGHLHHTLTQQQINEMGRVDVVLVPVDGSYTLDLDGMVEVLQALKAPVMIPMHYFSAFTLERFLARVREHWEVEVADIPSLVLSKTTLPAKPKVVVLPGR
jgi:L-ascorbate metabolism protein UlaG (beta-lactamase superfamily)